MPGTIGADDERRQRGVFKRVTWMTVGAAAGAAGTVWTQRKVRAGVDRLSAPSVAGAGRGALAGARRQLADAVREGRHTMRATEADLRERLDARLRTPSS